MKFTDDAIDSLFGHEAAERENIERLESFFVPLKEFDVVKSDSNLKVLVGFKGTGKTALQKMAYHELERDGVACVWVRPDDVVELYESISNEVDELKLITLWKKGISRLIGIRLVDAIGMTMNVDVEKALDWAQTTGYKRPDFVSDLAKKFQPLARHYVDSTSSSSGAGEHHIISRLIAQKRIFVFIDDMDRVWRGEASDMARLNALMNALGDLAGEMDGVRFRISLRTDVFVRWRNSSQVTDKFHSDTIQISWENSEIILALAKRISSFQGTVFGEVEAKEFASGNYSKFLNPVFEEYFSATVHWKGAKTSSVLLSQIRLRPRDLVLICRMAAKKAKDDNSERISGQHFESILEEYSTACESNLVIEFQNEMKEIRGLLHFMGPNADEVHKKEGKKTYFYSTEELLRKIGNAQSSMNLAMPGNVKPRDMEVAHFLYMIGFITATKYQDGKALRISWEKSPALLTGAVGDKGFGWEVHSAYRASISVGRFVNWKDTIEIV